VGDILITCTGGPAPITLGNPTDRATITVNFGVPVTSNQDATSTASGASEALLSIDEPNTVVSAGCRLWAECPDLPLHRSAEYGYSACSFHGLPGLSGAVVKRNRRLLRHVPDLDAVFDPDDRRR
jgi:hypothetical protein